MKLKLIDDYCSEWNSSGDGEKKDEPTFKKTSSVTRKYFITLRKLSRDTQCNPCLTKVIERNMLESKIQEIFLTNLAYDFTVCVWSFY